METFTLSNITYNDELNLRKDKKLEDLALALNDAFFIYKFLVCRNNCSDLTLIEILDHKPIVIELQKVIALTSAEKYNLKKMIVKLEEMSRKASFPSLAELCARIANILRRWLDTFLDKNDQLHLSMRQTKIGWGRLEMALANAGKETPWDGTDLTQEEKDNVRNVLLPEFIKNPPLKRSFPISEEELNRTIKGMNYLTITMKEIMTELFEILSLLFQVPPKRSTVNASNQGKVAENVFLVHLGVIYKHYFSEKPVIHKNEHKKGYYGKFLNFAISCLDIANINISAQNIGARWNRIGKSEVNILETHPALGTKNEIATKLLK